MEKQEDWILEGDDIEAGVAKTPARSLVARWIVGTYKKISKGTCHNAWRKKGAG